jgi:phage I-like protein
MTATATCDRKLEGHAPDWVHLFPAGRMTGRDGREFDLADPQAVIDAFEAGAVDLPVDYEHQSDRQPDARSGPVPAAGWIKELMSDASGLWGRVEWTAQARDLISERAYRYISPSFFFTKAGNAIIRLKGAGLVHKPNLHLKALARQEDDMNDDTGFLARLVAFLKLPEGTTEEEVFAKIEDLGRAVQDMATAAQRLNAELTELHSSMTSPDPAKFAPVAAMAELLSERNARAATMGEQAAAAKVEDAMRRGYLTPAMRGWATALCAQDPASFDGFIARATPAYAHLHQPSHTSASLPPFASATAARNDGAAQSVCAQLGLPPGSLKE